MPFLLLLWVGSGYLGYKLGQRKGIALLGMTVGLFLPVVGHLVLLIETQASTSSIPRHCAYCKAPVDLYAIRCYNCMSQFNNPGIRGAACMDPDKPLVGPTQDGWYSGWDEHGAAKGEWDG